MNLLFKIATSLAFAAIVLGMAGSARAVVLTRDSNTSQSLNAWGGNLSTKDVSDDLALKLQAALDKARVDGNTPAPGATVAIISRNQGTWFGASGISNVVTKTAVVPLDRFEIGSITKPFVATTVLQLIEEGKLNLEDTLDKWLPASIVGNIPYSKEITIRQLLNQTSGIYYYLDDGSFWTEAFKNPLRNWRPEELVAFAYGKQAKFAPGESWYYSSTNYILLGMIVEAATHSTIATQIRDRIIEPLGLKNTFFAEEEEIPGGFVRGYQDFNQDGTLDDLTDINLSYAWAGGAMVSNAPDVAQFAQGLFGGELLKPDTLKQMLTFVDVTGGYGSGYGLGLFDFETPWGEAWGHNGSTPGYGSDMLYLSDRGVIYVDLQNRQFPSDLITSMLNTLLGKGTTTVPEPSAVAGLTLVGAAMLLRKRRA